MIIPIPVRSRCCDGPSLSISDLAIMTKAMALVFSAAVVLCAVFFLTFKPLSLYVFKYQAYPIELPNYISERVVKAHKAGVTEISMRPWSWYQFSHPVDAVVDSESREMKNASRSATRIPFSMTLHANGTIDLFLYEKPQTVKDAKYLPAFVLSVVDSVGKEVAQAKMDEEFRRTGKY